MTNREIVKCKDELAVILKELWYEKGTKLNLHVSKLMDGIKKLQKLSEVIDARKYMGTGLGDMDSILPQIGQMGGFGGVVLGDKSEEYERICKEMSDNILYKLQTEMMFNACKSAKTSSIGAAIAAGLAFVTVVLSIFTMCLN